MYTLANFSNIQQPRKPRIPGLKTATKAVNAGIAGGGTGALAGLLIAPKSYKTQWAGAVAGTALGVGNSLRKSIKLKKPRRRYQ